MSNLKLTFEGATPDELHGAISDYMANINAGGTVVGAASGGATTKNKKATEAKKEMTLEELQEKFSKSGLNRAQKLALLSEFNCATTTELETKEYPDFIAKLDEAIAAK